MGSNGPFSDRVHAGKLLARQLSKYAGAPGLLVLALPRGGVPVAFEVARALHAELDLLLVRKLGLPQQPEFAMGAIGSNGVRVLQPGVPGLMGVTASQVEAVTLAEQAELARRERHYRGNRPPVQLDGRTVILVDDGIATGASMLAAIAVARQQSPLRLVVAVPVAAPATLEALRADAAHIDDVVCLASPARFRAVSPWYRKFDQTGDEQVQDLLARAWGPGLEPGHAPQATSVNDLERSGHERIEPTKHAR